MFCPKCGKPDQAPDSYCRNCGEFLPDLENPRRGRFRKKSPDEQLRVSLTLNLLSAIAGFSMAILLYATHLGKEEVSPSVYLAAAFLLVIGFWQTINFIFGLRLRNQFRKRRNNSSEEDIREKLFSESAAREFLHEADTNEFIAPSSVTENTTRTLDEIPRK